jgi:hypothetical protein
LVLALVQLVQHQYQAKVLYKQRALSKAHDMTTTTDLPTSNSLITVISALAMVYLFQLCVSLSVGVQTGLPFHSLSFSPPSLS